MHPHPHSLDLPVHHHPAALPASAARARFLHGHAPRKPTHLDEMASLVVLRVLNMTRWSSGTRSANAIQSIAFNATRRPAMVSTYSRTDVKPGQTQSCPRGPRRKRRCLVRRPCPPSPTRFLLNVAAAPSQKLLLGLPQFPSGLLRGWLLLS